MNAALACAIALALVLIVCLLTNSSYNRAKHEQTRVVETDQVSLNPASKR